MKHIPWWVIVALVLVHDNGTPYAEWMKSLVQPGRHGVSCCGEADQYWVKEYVPSHRKGVAFVAVVLTKDGKDTFMVDVPDDKVIWNQVNPTGRGVLFMAQNDAGEQNVLCFVPGTGT